MDFAVEADNNRKMKENEMIHKYINLSKKPWNMKLTVLSVIVSELRTDYKSLIKRLVELESKTS